MSPGVESHNGHKSADADAEQLDAAWAGLKTHIAELQDAANHYVAAKLDGARSTIRGLVLQLVLAVVAGVIGVAAISCAVYFLVSGMALGFTELLDGRAWAGQMLAGAAVLVPLVVGLLVGLRIAKRSSFLRLAADYEQKHQRQRERFGRDIVQRAAEERGQ